MLGLLLFQHLTEFDAMAHSCFTLSHLEQIPIQREHFHFFSWNSVRDLHSMAQMVCSLYWYLITLIMQGKYKANINTVCGIMLKWVLYAHSQIWCLQKMCTYESNNVHTKSELSMNFLLLSPAWVFFIFIHDVSKDPNYSTGSKKRLLEYNLWSLVLFLMHRIQHNTSNSLFFNYFYSHSDTVLDLSSQSDGQCCNSTLLWILCCMLFDFDSWRPHCRWLLWEISVLSICKEVCVFLPYLPYFVFVCLIVNLCKNIWTDFEKSGSFPWPRNLKILFHSETFISNIAAHT